MNPYLGLAAFNFTDTLIAARQAGVSWGRSFALAGAGAAISAVMPGGIGGFAAAGALHGVVSAAILGGDIGQAAWTGAVTGTVTWAAGPIIGGGVGSVLNGGSFGRGAAEGAYGAVATVAVVAAGTVTVSNANARTTAVAEAGQSGDPQLAVRQQGAPTSSEKQMSPQQVQQREMQKSLSLSKPQPQMKPYGQQSTFAGAGLDPAEATFRIIASEAIGFTALGIDRGGRSLLAAPHPGLKLLGLGMEFLAYGIAAVSLDILPGANLRVVPDNDPVDVYGR